MVNNMLVGVLSDSHDNVEGVEKAIEFFNDRGVDFVFHLGDIVSPFTLRLFSKLEPDFGVVFGNNDGDKLLLSSIAREYGFIISEPPLLLELASRKILALHGWRDPKYTIDLVDSLAKSRTYDVILYGHTHRVDVRKMGKTLVVNPGEVHGYISGKSTIAIIDLDKLEVEVVEI